MKHSFKLMAGLLFVLQISIVNAQSNQNTKVVVIPLMGDSGTILQPDGVTIFETVPDPDNNPNETVISGITYQAGSQIAIDSTADVNRKVIRFSPSNGGVRDNHQPSLGIHHVIATTGAFPNASSTSTGQLFLGDVLMTAISSFAVPSNTVLCDGQLIAINQNAALFSLLGTNYGGDGRTTFAVPDLRGRTAVHPGTGPGLSNIRLGQRFGSPTVDLN